MDSLHDELARFDAFGTHTQVSALAGVPVYVNEFWTAKQRAAHSLHEVSYRACFKPQLPRFFIERLTREGDAVYDPFMGRGTTLLESALLGRSVIGCDINPLSAMLIAPRLSPPSLGEIEHALAKIDWRYDGAMDESLLAFYQRDTLRQIYALKEQVAGSRWLVAANSEPRSPNSELRTLDWLRMVATNRLTGHSNGFFSVYTLPPNQAVTVERQRKINTQRNQQPEFRDVPSLILKKSRALLRDAISRPPHAPLVQLLTQSCDATPQIADASVALVVTSPPFLDVVDYATDNWLRCWFNGLDARAIPIWQIKNIEMWRERMHAVFVELARVLRRGGHVAFEVGEVRGGKVRLEDEVILAARSTGLEPQLVMINTQQFTKTSNIWGMTNQQKGTNTNRIVLLRRT